jgi:hypothetical protein
LAKFRGDLLVLPVAGHKCFREIRFLAERVNGIARRARAVSKLQAAPD